MVAVEVEIIHLQVKEVMKSLRITFLRERRKEEGSYTTGKGTKDIYKSKWKFFEVLAFLAAYVRPIQTVSSISDEPLARDSDADEAVYEDETESIGEGEDS